VEVVVYLALVGIAVVRRRTLYVRAYVPARRTRPVRIRPAVVVAFPPHLEQQVVGAVVLESRVELEAEPLVRRRGDAAGFAVENLDRRIAVVIVGVRVGERSLGGVAALEAELVEIARLLRQGGVPLPLGNVARGKGVRLQDQRLAPEGVVSTPAERIVGREIAAADGDEAGLGRGPG
jgi:hypothetical protein